MAFMVVPSLAVGAAQDAVAAGAGRGDGFGAGGLGFVQPLGGGEVGEVRVGLRDGAAAAAAPGRFLGALHLHQLQAGDGLEHVARRLVDAEGAVVAGPRRVVDHRLAVDLGLLAVPGHVVLALAAEVAGVVIGDLHRHRLGELELALFDEPVGHLGGVQHLDAVVVAGDLGIEPLERPEAGGAGGDDGLDAGRRPLLEVGLGGRGEVVAVAHVVGLAAAAALVAVDGEVEAALGEHPRGRLDGARAGPGLNE